MFPSKRHFLSTSNLLHLLQLSQPTMLQPVEKYHFKMLSYYLPPAKTRDSQRFKECKVTEMTKRRSI